MFAIVLLACAAVAEAATIFPYYPRNPFLAPQHLRVPGQGYDFLYGVADPKTGDFKSHQETKVGDTVQGRYSFIDPTGVRRTVTYSADEANGFNAVVHEEPPVTPSTPAVTHTTPSSTPSSSEDQEDETKTEDDSMTTTENPKKETPKSTPPPFILPRFPVLPYANPYYPYYPLYHARYPPVFPPFPHY